MSPTFNISSEQVNGTDGWISSDHSEGLVDDNASVAESILSKSLPNHSNFPDRSSSRDRAGMGRWMSTWWAKDKPKRERPPLAVATSSFIHPSASKAPTSPQIPKSHLSPEDPDPSSTLKPAKMTRRKVSKSVFGSLGFSIMNPTILTSMKKPVASSDRDDKEVSPPHEVSHEHQEREFVPPTPSMTSPIQATVALPSSPAPPRLTLPSDQKGVDSDEIKNIQPEDEWPPQQGSSLQAIINATRVMTENPASILAEQSRDSGELIARLSMDLVRNAREDGLSARLRQREKKPQQIGVVSDRPQALALINPSRTEDARATLNKTLLRTPSKERTAKSTSSDKSPYFASALFGPFISEQHRRISSAVDAVQKSAGIIPSKKQTEAQSSGQRSEQASDAPKPRSVPLDSIIPDSSKPPTQFLARRYLSLTAKDFKPHIQISSAATRHAVNQEDLGPEPLTDRYGFVYDIAQYDTLLLRRAIDCQTVAPACLTGIKISDRHEEDGWSDGEEDDTDTKTIDIVKGECDCDDDGGVQKVMETPPDDAKSVRSLRSQKDPSASSSPSLHRRTSIVSSRKRSPTISSSVADAPSASLSQSFSAILTFDDTSPRHVCEKSIRRMLGQLTTIHDRQQQARKKAWDAFLKQRTKAKSKNQSTTPSGTSQSAGPATLLGQESTIEDEDELHSGGGGMVGFSDMGRNSSKDEKREFSRLIREGVPLDYRAKVWSECSGALEMTEPGVFREFLHKPAGDGDSVLREIEKDVGRTMPLNVFFGGDGPGVEKLRNVLTTYSRSVNLSHLSTT